MADENSSGTLELLLTAPVKDHELVIGKWLGTFLLLLTLIALTGFYPLVLNALVEPGIDLAKLAANYVGIILFAGTLAAIGVWSHPSA